MDDGDHVLARLACGRTCDGWRIVVLAAPLLLSLHWRPALQCPKETLTKSNEEDTLSACTLNDGPNYHANDTHANTTDSNDQLHNDKPNSEPDELCMHVCTRLHMLEKLWDMMGKGKKS